MFPAQKDVVAFYGNPTGAHGEADPAWCHVNLTTVPFPWKAVAAWDKSVRISGARVHFKCAGSLQAIFAAIWKASGESQAAIEAKRMHLFGGGFNYRTMRGSHRLSMHAYGCAVDFDPEKNGLGNRRPSMDAGVVKIFEDAGWTWGGRWSGGRCDGMHFQAARL